MVAFHHLLLRDADKRGRLPRSSRTMNKRSILGRWNRRVNVWVWVVSDLGAFGQLQSVFDIDAEVADGTFDLRMAEKDLNCA
jgi:hypothetical protein